MTIQGAIEEIKMLEVPFYAKPIKAKIIETIIDECRDYYYQGRAETIDEIIKTLAESEDTILSDRQYYILMELKEQNNELLG